MRRICLPGFASSGAKRFQTSSVNFSSAEQARIEYEQDHRYHRSQRVTIHVGAACGVRQGFPAMASCSAVSVSGPCLRAVETYPRTRSQLRAPLVAR